MRHDVPIYFAKYSHDINLIDNPGWKQPRRYVKNTKKMNRLLRAANAKQLRNTVNIKFGVNIPCYHKYSMIFDYNNGSTNWKAAELLELNKIYNSNPLEYLRPVSKERIPPGHTKIQVHLIYYYKQDGIYKARMVDSGNMTGPNIDPYSSRVI